MHGIGGRTVAEAQARMTYAEASAWAAYRLKYGSLNVGLRLEVGFGQVLSMIANVVGNKTDPRDFMPHIPKPEPEPFTFDKLVRIMGAVKKR